MRILDMQDGLRKYAGPGHWNDPDMMEVGNGMSESEDRAHFTMWSMLSAPLVAGNDLNNMSEATRKILTNKKIIAIDQDSLGVQAFEYSTKDGLETWFKPLADGEWAITFLNRTEEPRKVEFDWEAHKIKDRDFDYEVDFSKSTFEVNDL